MHELAAPLPSYFRAGEPIAVAVSGGGDSMALLGLLLECAGESKVHALIVDHNLRGGSGAEAAKVAQMVQGMGARASVLKWSSADNINSGVQGKARTARYDLLGAACRQLGASQIFMGHTRDDHIETIYMRREAGAGERGLAGMTARTYAPIWPALRGITLIRPLLGVSRAQLRGYNQLISISWVEDPSNEDETYSRVRARKALAGAAPSDGARLLVLGQQSREQLKSQNKALAILCGEYVSPLRGGAFYIDKRALAATHSEVLVSRLILCSSGRAQSLHTEPVKSLITAMADLDFKARTLGGSVINPYQKGFLMSREPSAVTGERKGRDPVTTPLIAGEEVSWDGRFALNVEAEDLMAAPLWRVREKLPKRAQADLKAYHPSLRRSLPVIMQGSNVVAVPHLDGFEDNVAYKLQDLTRLRLYGLNQI